MKAAVSGASTHFGRLDSTLNSVGKHRFGDLDTTPLVEWDLMFAVHATGTVLVCRASLPYLREPGEGLIVNIVSATTVVARARNAAYSDAKGTVLAPSRQLALDPAPEKIRVKSHTLARTLTPYVNQYRSRQWAITEAPAVCGCDHAGQPGGFTGDDCRELCFLGQRQFCDRNCASG